MSRALNIDATEAHVRQTCTKSKAQITAIESLPSGGTRVVLRNGDEAAAIAKAYGTKVIKGPITRQPIRTLHG